MARRLCFEAVPVAGRVVALGGALLCGGWGEEGDGGRGRGQGVQCEGDLERSRRHGNGRGETAVHGGVQGGGLRSRR